MPSGLAISYAITASELNNLQRELFNATVIRAINDFLYGEPMKAMLNHSG